jgi:hypothetical protein
MEREEAEFRAANKRITTMAEELRKAELVRDRLEGLARLMGSYPEGHDMRARLEDLHVNRALGEVDEDIRLLTDALQHPRGTGGRARRDARVGTLPYGMSRKGSPVRLEGRSGRASRLRLRAGRPPPPAAPMPAPRTPRASRRSPPSAFLARVSLLRRPLCEQPAGLLDHLRLHLAEAVRQLVVLGEPRVPRGGPAQQAGRRASSGRSCVRRSSLRRSPLDRVAFVRRRGECMRWACSSC